jgi:SAM-dependent methyltransferase
VVLDVSGGLPFCTNSLSRIWCYDVVEHIEDIPALMGELHRVLEPNGTLFVTTPHFSCANSWTDPTHKHHFGWRSFDYFTAQHALHYYSTARYEIVHRVLRFHSGLVDGIIRRFAKRWPDIYEHRWAWIFPAWYLEFELKAIKDGEEGRVTIREEGRGKREA